MENTNINDLINKMYDITMGNEYKVQKCCVCNTTFEGYGNNPSGVIQVINGKPYKLTWNKKDRCCDKCNNQLVIPGRMFVSQTDVSVPLRQANKNPRKLRKGTFIGNNE